MGTRTELAQELVQYAAELRRLAGELMLADKYADKFKPEHLNDVDARARAAAAAATAKVKAVGARL